ncbi:MAG: helix-turn-helix domain-containing protein [Deltaproteobacteria bacterium]|nr:helix-turn-helix domain-containing protein [Deltaproteobacteria bacterium]
MAEIFLNTREVAEYLQINEKQVYRLIRNGGLPCTRVTGKWLFPKSQVEEWVQHSARARSLSALRSSAAVVERFGVDRGLLVAGSNDLLFDALLEMTRQQHPEYLIYTINLGSFGGLDALKQGKAHVALAHLRDPATGNYNTPFLEQDFPHDTVVAVTLWRRRVGFLQRLGDGAPPVGTFSDLSQSNLRFINRQRGSGIRWLVEQRMQEENLKPSQIKGYTDDAWTHWEVGLAVLRRQADVGVATESVARALGLSFQMLVEERFDLVVPKDHYFTKPVQAVLEVLGSQALTARAAALGGYATNETGKIAFPE